MISNARDFTFKRVALLNADLTRFNYARTRIRCTFLYHRQKSAPEKKRFLRDLWFRLSFFAVVTKTVERQYSRTSSTTNLDFFFFFEKVAVFCLGILDNGKRRYVKRPIVQEIEFFSNRFTSDREVRICRVSTVRFFTVPIPFWEALPRLSYLLMMDDFWRQTRATGTNRFSG